MQAMYLRTLPSIRERCLKVHDLAKRGGLQYFDYHPEKEDAVIEFCTSIIEVCVTSSPPCSDVSRSILSREISGDIFLL